MNSKNKAKSFLGKYKMLVGIVAILPILAFYAAYYIESATMRVADNDRQPPIYKPNDIEPSFFIIIAIVVIVLLFAYFIWSYYVSKRNNNEPLYTFALQKTTNLESGETTKNIKIVTDISESIRGFLDLLQNSILSIHTATTKKLGHHISKRDDYNEPSYTFTLQKATKNTKIGTDIPEDIEKLLGTLQHGTPFIRAAAAKKLGHIGIYHKKIEAALQRTIELNEDETTQQSAHQAIMQLHKYHAMEKQNTTSAPSISRPARSEKKTNSPSLLKSRLKWIPSAKYTLLATMFISFIIASSFVQVGVEIAVIQMGYASNTHLANSGIQLTQIENESPLFDSNVMRFVLVVPISLFISWVCYFFKHYYTGLLFVLIPILYTGFMIYLVFPISEFGKVFFFMLSVDSLISGLMATVIYWLIPMSLLALVVKFFTSRSK